MWTKYIYVLVLLFIVPFLIGQLPLPNNLVIEQPKEPETVFASSYVAPLQPIRTLVYFTHTHESYKPIVADKTGLQAVYNEESNIASLQDVITFYFGQQQIETEFVQVNVAEQMKLAGVKFNKAYDVARPFVASAIQSKQYDYIIDFHRDAVGKDITTTHFNGVDYARVAFIVGAAHPQFGYNANLANQLDVAMNTIIPEISRGVFEKKGAGVDGIYNQDLAPNMLLIELGGIDNTESEVLQTIAIIAQALRQIKASE